MLLSQNKPVEPKPKLDKVDPRRVVADILVGRADEVMETARKYYPTQIAELESRLAQVILSGSLKGPVTGEELYSFLRQLGLNFSLDTKIRIREGGKLKSLEEKLRGRD